MQSGNGIIRVRVYFAKKRGKKCYSLLKKGQKVHIFCISAELRVCYCASATI